MIRCSRASLTLLSLTIGVAVASPAAAQAPPVPDWSNPALCRERGQRVFPLPRERVEKKKLVKLLERISSEASIGVLWPEKGHDPWTTKCHVPIKKIPQIPGEDCDPTDEISGDEWLAIRSVGNDRYQALLMDGHQTKLVPLELIRNSNDTHEMWLLSGNVPGRTGPRRYSIHFEDAEVGSEFVKRYVVEVYDPSHTGCMKNFPKEELVCKPPSNRPACGPEARLDGSVRILQGSSGGGHEPPDDPPLNP